MQSIWDCWAGESEAVAVPWAEAMAAKVPATKTEVKRILMDWLGVGN